MRFRACFFSSPLIRPDIGILYFSKSKKESARFLSPPSFFPFPSPSSRLPVPVSRFSPPGSCLSFRPSPEMTRNRAKVPLHCFFHQAICSSVMTSYLVILLAIRILFAIRILLAIRILVTL